MILRWHQHKILLYSFKNQNVFLPLSENVCEYLPSHPHTAAQQDTSETRSYKLFLLRLTNLHTLSQRDTITKVGFHSHDKLGNHKEVCVSYLSVLFHFIYIYVILQFTI